MFRKIGLTVICAGSFLFSTTAFSSEYLLRKGASIDYELPVGVQQVFSNMFFWKIVANCTITSDNQTTNPLSINMLRKTGSISYHDYSRQLSAGDTVEINIVSGDTIHLTADSGAKVGLLNHSTSTLRAHCETEG